MLTFEFNFETVPKSSLLTLDRLLHWKPIHRPSYFQVMIYVATFSYKYSTKARDESTWNFSLINNLIVLIFRFLPKFLFWNLIKTARINLYDQLSWRKVISQKVFANVALNSIFPISVNTSPSRDLHSCSCLLVNRIAFQDTRYCFDYSSFVNI